MLRGVSAARLPRGVRLRAGRAGDGTQAAAVFHAAVRLGTAGFYDADERAAWSPAPPAGDWENRLLSGTCLVAEHRRRTLVGFMTLGDDGFLDFAYVAPEWAGAGVGGALYAGIEAAARRLELPHLTTEASILAERFLRARGWQVLARQSVIRNGVALTNFRMMKAIGPCRLAKAAQLPHPAP